MTGVGHACQGDMHAEEMVTVLYVNVNCICNLISSHLINEYIRHPAHTKTPKLF